MRYSALALLLAHRVGGSVNVGKRDVVEVVLDSVCECWHAHLEEKRMVRDVQVARNVRQKAFPP